MTLVYYALQQFINALSIGSLYALMAVGLAMVFGILRLINFAHGDLMMIAAYLAVFALGAKLPLSLVLVVIIAGTVLVGLLMERLAYRPIRGAPDVATLLASFGGTYGAGSPVGKNAFAVMIDDPDHDMVVGTTFLTARDNGI